MDHEKPEAVTPGVREYISEQGQSSDSTERQMGHDLLADESAGVEERRERRGESLW